MAGQHRQGEHRLVRRAPVAVAFDAPAHPQERRPERGVLLGEGRDVARSTPQTVCRGIERPAVGGGQQLLDAAGVLVEERGVEQPLGAEVAGHGQRQHDVGARQRRDVPIGARRHGGTPGIDHGEAGAAAPACCTSGGKWVFDTVGLAPHTTTWAAWTTSSGSADSMRPKTSSHASPAVAAQMVSCTSAAPSRRNSRSVRAALASTPAEEL